VICLGIQPGSAQQGNETDAAFGGALTRFAHSARFIARSLGSLSLLERYYTMKSIVVALVALLGVVSCTPGNPLSSRSLPVGEYRGTYSMISLKGTIVQQAPVTFIFSGCVNCFV
jgi:hypothetical protein